MPFKSPKQKRFFLACLKGSIKTKECPPKSVIKEYLKKEESRSNGAKRKKKNKSRKTKKK